eukprot:2955100-Rhodomonas_salina.1
MEFECERIGGSGRLVGPYPISYRTWDSRPLGRYPVSVPLIAEQSSRAILAQYHTSHSRPAERYPTSVPLIA